MAAVPSWNPRYRKLGEVKLRASLQPISRRPVVRSTQVPAPA